jgi:hypothetical protein
VCSRGLAGWPVDTSWYGAMELPLAIGDCNGNPMVMLGSALVLAAVMQKRRTKEIRHYYSKRAYGGQIS